MPRYIQRHKFHPVSASSLPRLAARHFACPFLWNDSPSQRQILSAPCSFSTRLGCPSVWCCPLMTCYPYLPMLPSIQFAILELFMCTLDGKLIRNHTHMFALNASLNSRIHSDCAAHLYLQTARNYVIAHSHAHMHLHWH